MKAASNRRSAKVLHERVPVRRHEKDKDTAAFVRGREDLPRGIERHGAKSSRTFVVRAQLKILNT
ncbi:hypothetical protein PsorP6_000851 [Peronosclerospora sorghi]|uniref:Uncharacterized protein n=1 Tax=Peronosclerospora sorghi TaxID=230839 RepID=A0ACC0WV18_9STRA|nr:hypothetical protein PsorP6_000851 [Peronosclerospora sorghi]